MANLKAIKQPIVMEMRPKHLEKSIHTFCLRHKATRLKGGEVKKEPVQIHPSTWVEG